MLYKCRAHTGICVLEVAKSEVSCATYGHIKDRQQSYSRSIIIERDYITLKPIFHCDAKYLASGVGVGQCPRRQIFALPNTKYTNMLVYFGVTPDANPRRQS